MQPKRQLRKTASEKEIQNSILEWLRYKRNCIAFPINTMGVWDEKKQTYRKMQKYFIKGTPDILMCYRGYFVALEVKTPREMKKLRSNPSEHQKNQIQVMDWIRGAQGTAFLVSDLLDAQAIVAHLDESLDIRFALSERKPQAV